MSVIEGFGEVPRWAEELHLALAFAPQLHLSGNLDDLHLAGAGADRWQGRTTEDVIGGVLKANGYYLVLAHDTVAGLRVLWAGQRDLAGAIGAQVMTRERTEVNRYGGMPAGKTLEGTLQALADVWIEAGGAGAADGVGAGAAAGGARAGGELGEVPRLTGADPNQNPRLTDAQLSQLMYAVAKSAWPCALLVEHASWLAQAVPEQPSPALPYRPSDGPECFRVALKLCQDAPGLQGVALGRRQVYNPIIWLSGQPHDLPAWLTRQDGFRHINVERPEREDRRAYAEHTLGPAFADYRDLGPEQRAAFLDRLTAATDGLSVRALAAIGRLVRDEGMAADDATRAVSLYKFGVKDSPWRRADLAERIRDGGCLEHLRQSIFGQDAALQAAARCVNKAVLGLSSLGAESSPNRPRGVLFLAGPTGTGKTELAKRIAEFVFGSADAFTVFDMSEYSAPHSDTRLIGAPPSYVGYDSGGQLTNAVRDKPFSLLLFDEIEK